MRKRATSCLALAAGMLAFLLVLTIALGLRQQAADSRPAALARSRSDSPSDDGVRAGRAAEGSPPTPAPPSPAPRISRATARPVDGLLGWDPGIVLRTAAGVVFSGVAIGASIAPGVEVAPTGLIVDAGWYRYELQWSDVADIYCAPTSDVGNPQVLVIRTTSDELIVHSDLAVENTRDVAEAAMKQRAQALGEPWSEGMGGEACAP